MTSKLPPPSAKRKAAVQQETVRQTVLAAWKKPPKRARNRFLPKAKSATNKAPAKSQLIAVVLICKNISSRKKSVTEPKTKTKTAVINTALGIGWRKIFNSASCATTAALTLCRQNKILIADKKSEKKNNGRKKIKPLMFHRREKNSTRRS